MTYFEVVLVDDQLVGRINSNPAFFGQEALYPRMELTVSSEVMPLAQVAGLHTSRVSQAVGTNR